MNISKCFPLKSIPIKNSEIQNINIPKSRGNNKSSNVTLNYESLFPLIKRLLRIFNILNKTLNDLKV